ncbi:MAG: hypothetical protein I8H71_09890 [Xanthomonadaceae bacterium]|nr:hypothetical protein [Xanthomonadaceae bacterium]
MNWFKKIQPSLRAASGLEWRLWRKLPLIALAGTALPLLCLALVHLLSDSAPSSAELRRVQMMDYVIGGVIVFHWSMVVTVGIGCVIVMVMKGPGYVADGYRVSHSDQPRATPETAEEASAYRLPKANEPSE